MCFCVIDVGATILSVASLAIPSGNLKEEPKLSLAHLCTCY